MTSATPQSNWFSRTDLTGGIVRFTEPHVREFMRANIYFIPGRDRDLLVDTGMGLSSLAAVLPETGSPLLAVATHIHVDHVGSLHEFANRAGPRASGAAFATMPERLTYANMFREMVDPLGALPAEGWEIASYYIEPAPLTRLLSEGETIDLGDRTFRVIELHGHSPDSIGLFDDHDGLFFSGDAIYDETLIDELPNSDRRVYRETMRRLLELPVRLVLGGHGEPFGGERMREIARAYLRK
ncbi:MBL fold metallo-hydrolase [Arvimicrobium flavum]|uniref:MBL fold metallo-hydrolase n=1 Tax=Arvimicrobium flavum TaxID=3393320 RepID=UPI00398D3515